MTLDAALMRAIVEQPDDDLPRLVAADWLEEHNQRERAEFIRVQVELAGWDWGPHTDEEMHLAIRCQCAGCALRQRERELANNNPNGMRNIDWWAITDKVPTDHVHTYEFSRGFVSRLTTSWADWSQHSAALLAVCPITGKDGCVRLTTWPPFASTDNTVLNDYFAAEWPGGVRFKLPALATTGYTAVGSGENVPR